MIDSPSYQNHPNLAWSPRALQLLREGKIMLENETLTNFLDRVLDDVYSVEILFGQTPRGTRAHVEEFANLMVNRQVIPGTPLMTNAGRNGRSLSSCIVAPVDLWDLEGAGRHISAIYKQNMGCGFDLSRYPDPESLLVHLNELARRETVTGCERYIGNLAALDVRHPRIESFICAKRTARMEHFNISVVTDEEFIKKAMTEKNHQGQEKSARKLMRMIAECAWHNGEPGLLFMDRINRDNPVEDEQPYVCTPPCAEMGLSVGETCQFAYISLPCFVKRNTSGCFVDWNELRRAVWATTRFLDNAVEANVTRHLHQRSSYFASYRRRIGIGVCGLAEVFLAFDYNYGAPESIRIARDMLGFISYESKLASVELSKQRGACPAMNSAANKLVSGFLIESKYATSSIRSVSETEWLALARGIRESRQLRNLTTTALPPTGRASLLAGTSASIEPLFDLRDASGSILPSVMRILSEEGGRLGILNQVIEEVATVGALKESSLSLSPRLETLRVGVQIEATKHLEVVAALSGVNGVVDEAASKTVNLPSSTTIDDIEDVFYTAWIMGTKNVSVYRDKRTNKIC